MTVPGITSKILEEMDSVLVGWFSSMDYETLFHVPFNPFEDARKFQLSMIDPTYNSLNQSLTTILDWGVSNTYSWIIKLQDYLIDELASLDGYSVVSSLEAEERSGIIIFKADNPAKVVNYLISKNITVSVRGDGIRVSPHGYNTMEDIDRLIEGLKHRSSN